MAIEFSQPGWFAPDIAAGYGALQQQNIDREFYLKKAIAEAPRYFQPHGGGGYGGGGYGGGRMGGQGLGVAVEPPPQPAQRDHVGEQLALEQGRLTIAENQRMQQLQQGMASIDRLLADNTITQDEANDMRAMVQMGPSGLNVMQMRAARAAAQMAETRQREAQQEFEFQNRMLNGSEVERAELMKKIMWRRRDNDGVERDYQWNWQQRNWVPVVDPSIEIRRQDTAQRERERLVLRNDSQRDQVRRTAQEAGQQAERNVPPESAFPSLPNETPEARTARYRAQVVQRTYDEGMALADRQDIREEVRQEMDLEARRPQPPAWATNPEQRSDELWLRTERRLRDRGTAVATTVEELALGRAAPAPQPIPEAARQPGRERSLLPEGQRNTLEALDRLRERARFREITNPPPQGQRYTWRSLNRAIALYQQYGNTLAMPPREREFYESLIANYERVLPHRPPIVTHPPTDRRFSTNLPNYGEQVPGM